MLRHKNIERVCLIVLAAVILVTLLFMAMESAGMIGEETGMDYEALLFDQSRVHTIDITMEDWDAFLETATNEEYADCQITIDGELYKNVAIRAKGNTSLSSVKQYGNNRYSFKVEFDHYQSGMTYHGLDKLSLNNLIQDNTYLKDYTAYTLMGKMDVAAPLCSFVQINVNGEPWGLYLAVEGVEDSFLTRNYGKDHGELYKPDSMSFGGGRGNGREFDADKMMAQFENREGEAPPMPEEGGFPGMPQMMPEGQTPPFGDMPEMGSMPPAFDEMPDMSDMPQMPEDGQIPDMEKWPQSFSEEAEKSEQNGRRGGGPMGGVGSSDVKLVYTDDNPESYANIFDNAKTDISEADQARLIASLKALGEGDTSVIDEDAVIRYMAVHNFLCNDDSYTGMMIHNYYLYEEDGVMEMIPWDYNLAMGGFSGGGNATSTVNTGINDLVKNGGGDRPMADWILQDPETTEQYHAAYQKFMDTVFSSGWFEQELTRVIDMIAPYVKDDPTAFCTYEEFETATRTLLSFCMKRAESVELQLSGELATTSARQEVAGKMDASELNLRSMGGMGNMGDGSFPGMPGGDFSRKRPDSNREDHTEKDGAPETRKESFVPPNGEMKEFGVNPAGKPDGFSPESFPSQDRFERSGESAAAPAQTLPMLALCIVTLLAALIIAKRCRNHQ